MLYEVITLQSLLKRGLRGVELISSDDHSGLRAALKSCFPGVPWNRCQFHLQQNAQAYVPRKEMQTEVAEDIRTIFQAPDRAKEEAYLTQAVVITSYSIHYTKLYDSRQSQDGYPQRQG